MQNSNKPDTRHSLSFIHAAPPKKKTNNPALGETRVITGHGLHNPKAVVDDTPKTVEETVSKAQTDEAEEKLEAVSANVEIK